MFIHTSFYFHFHPFIHFFFLNVFRHSVGTIFYWKCQQKNRKGLLCEARPDDNTLIEPFFKYLWSNNFLNMLNGVPVLKLCCFTYFILDLICISAFMVYLIFFLFFFFFSGDIWNKAKCLNKQEKRHLVSLYQINREQNCLAKLHLSRNDISP